MTLTDLVAELRRELSAELPMRLHQYNPSGRHTKGGPAEGETASGEPVDRRMQSGPGNIGMTGLPFSRAFDRYLSGEHGGDFLAADSLTEIREHCRIQHWREQHTGDDPYAWNLCARIAIAHVELRQPLTFIAAVEGIDTWLARNLLTSALTHAREWRQDRKAGIRIGDESRSQLDTAEALPVVLAREHSVLHEQRVWELWRAKFPYLPAWEIELRRRRAFHAVHCSGRCELLMEGVA